MFEDLRIEFAWLERETGNALERAFTASIGVAVGEEYLTRLDDLGARTVSNQVRASVWQLAGWFAANWWRLRWEPAPAQWWNDPDWRMSHSMAAAGGGYVWPNAIFASDGDSMGISSKPKWKGAPFEPIRYINQVDARITTAEFEQKIDAFMDGVLSRMQSFQLNDDSLPSLWAEIIKERGDPEVSRQRKLEAMAGFDPDQAPTEVLENLLEDQNDLGSNALAEMAAEARHEIGAAMTIIEELGRARSNPKLGGFRARVPELRLPATVSEGGDAPWRKAVDLARHARDQWGLGTKPVRNKTLADILGATAAVFSDAPIVKTPIPLGIRARRANEFDIYFNRRNPTTRRFAASRLLGDHLYFTNRERLLPATHTKTSRQKFQRAFAQEFLCPIDALREKIQTAEPNEDDISEAAAHFHVSPLMVRTTLVNNGQLEREALTWPD
jgi:Zn-dependent peptidase ImmA (M78 family)